MYIGRCIAESSSAQSLVSTSMASAGVAVGTSMMVSVGSSSVSNAGLNVISVLNMIQGIELLALLELEYTEELNAFFKGFEFALLSVPKEYNMIIKYNEHFRTREPPSMRLADFGFTSIYVLVQHIGFVFIMLCLALLWLLLKLLSRRPCSRHNRCFLRARAKLHELHFKLWVAFYAPLLISANINI